MSEEKKKELYYELQALDEQIKALNEHLETVEGQIGELQSSKEILNKFQTVKKGTELRVPLSSGIYLKAELSDNSNILVNVGASVAVEKKPAEVVNILDSQTQELLEYRQNIVVNMQEQIKQIEKIQAKLEKLNSK